MFVCEKDYSCCGFQYWDRWEDVEQDAKDCGHLIEVAPVVHGRWIWKGRNSGWICSECESGCMLNCESDWYKSDFCPHCGADMRERRGDG